MDRPLHALASLAVADLDEALRVAAAWADATAGVIAPEVWAEMLDARISPAPTVRKPDRPVRGAPRQRYAVVERSGNRNSRKMVTRRTWPPQWTGFGPRYEDTFDTWQFVADALDGEGRIPVGAGQGSGGWHSIIDVNDYRGRIVVQWWIHPLEPSDHPVFPPPDDQWVASVLRGLVAAAEPDFAAVTLEVNYTGFETAAGGWPQYCLPAAAEVLRGYEWLTVVAAPVVAQLGGYEALRKSGAFWAVEPLPGGGAWLQATERADDYDLDHVTAVFEVLRPALPDRKAVPHVIDPNPWVLDRSGLAPDPGPPPLP